jgi:hypothetical protein
VALVQGRANIDRVLHVNGCRLTREPRVSECGGCRGGQRLPIPTLAHVRRRVVAPLQDLRQHELELLGAHHRQALRDALCRTAALRAAGNSTHQQSFMVRVYNSSKLTEHYTQTISQTGQ